MTNSMTNTLDPLMPKILARGMQNFREQTIMPQLVNNDLSSEAAQKGDTIEIPQIPQAEVQTVEPNHTPPPPPRSEIGKYTLTLDNWKKTSFSLSDDELMRIDAEWDFIPFVMQESINALAESVNASFISQVFAVNNAENIIGNHTRPLFSQDSQWQGKDNHRIQPALMANKILNKNHAPKEGRFAMLCYEHEAMALELSEFTHADKSGDGMALRSGEVGKKYGIEWFNTKHLGKHVGSSNSSFRLNATTEAGDASIKVKNAENEFFQGDLIADSDDAIVGSVNKDLGEFAANKRNLDLALPLQRRVTSTQDLKAVSEHQNSLVFHRDAFAFAMRPLMSLGTDYGGGSQIMSITDPHSGLTLRLEISRHHKQIVWEFDILWGVKLIRPELAIRLVSK